MGKNDSAGLRTDERELVPTAIPYGTGAPSLPGLIRLGRQAVKFWFSGLVIDVGADQGDQTKHDDD
jgi:hypothetical protein